VIQNATKQQILRSCIVNSYLWGKCTLLQLTENMRLKSGTLSNRDKEELSNFVEWLFRVGNGTEPFVPIPNEPKSSFIEIPQYLHLSPSHKTLMNSYCSSTTQVFNRQNLLHISATVQS
jgi:hypothetical protein